MPRRLLILRDCRRLGECEVRGCLPDALKCLAFFQPLVVDETCRQLAKLAGQLEEAILVNVSKRGGATIEPRSGGAPRLAGA